MKESNITRLIIAAACQIKARLWLNPRGVGWTGKLVDDNGKGRVVLINAARVTFGLGPNGSGDSIGDSAPILITQDMVGKYYRVPASVEVKLPGEKPRPDQWDWIEFCISRGWRAGWATNEKEAQAILDGAPEAWQVTRP